MPELLTVAEVAELLGIKPASVRQTLSRHGIREQRGYSREQVEKLRGPRRGRRVSLIRPDQEGPTDA